MDNISKNLLLYYYPQYKNYNDNLLIKVFFNIYNQFDYKFYINFYNDLKNKDYKEAYRHWNYYGKKEKRICNLFQSKIHYSISFSKIKNYNNLIFEKDEKKINILIRTCYRPEYFNKCINSVLNQKYSNYNILISYDDLRCENYLISNNEKIRNIYIDKNNYVLNNEKYFYNDYLNNLHKEVNEGFIIYLDDDDMLTHYNCLKIINENIDNNNDLLIYKFLRPDKCIYPQNIDNIELGEISTSNFCFNINYLNLVKWKKMQCGDYYFFKDLINNNGYKIKFMDKIICKTIFDNKTGNFGL